MLPTIIEFDYKEKRRLVIEIGDDKRGNGCILCQQLSPKRGLRSFKPEQRTNLKKLGILRTIYHLGRREWAILRT